MLDRLTFARAIKVDDVRPFGARFRERAQCSDWLIGIGGDIVEATLLQTHDASA